MGLTTLYAYEDQWNPGKKQFFMSLERCKTFTEAIWEFDADLKGGATLITSRQILLAYNNFHIFF